LKKCIVGVVKSCVVDEIVKITKMVVVGWTIWRKIMVFWDLKMIILIFIIIIEWKEI
jgi:hypothetical protein